MDGGTAALFSTMSVPFVFDEAAERRLAAQDVTEEPAKRAREAQVTWDCITSASCTG